MTCRNGGPDRRCRRRRAWSLRSAACHNHDVEGYSGSRAARPRSRTLSRRGSVTSSSNTSRSMSLSAPRSGGTEPKTINPCRPCRRGEATTISSRSCSSTSTTRIILRRRISFAIHIHGSWKVARRRSPPAGTGCARYRLQSWSRMARFCRYCFRAWRHPHSPFPPRAAGLPMCSASAPTRCVAGPTPAGSPVSAARATSAASWPTTSRRSWPERPRRTVRNRGPAARTALPVAVRDQP